MSDSEEDFSDNEIRAKSSQHRKRVIGSDDEDDDDSDAPVSKAKIFKRSDSDLEESGAESGDSDAPAQNPFDNSDDDDDDDDEAEQDPKKQVDSIFGGDDDDDNNEDKSDSGSDDDNKGKRKRRHVESDDEVDDDDYDLLEENLGTSVSREREPGTNKNLRRLQQDSDSEGDLQEQLDDLGDELSGEEGYGEGYGSDEEQGDGEFVVGDTGDTGRSDRFYANQNMAEAEEIFGGDLEEFLLGSDEEEVQEAVPLSEIFEPEVLKKQHMTEQDTEIKVKDVPERFQALQVDRSEPNDKELELEAEFIYENCRMGRRSQPVCISTLVEILRFFRIDLYEVPFIKTYRRQHYDGVFEDKDLWRILEWDSKFRTFYDVRQGLKRVIKRIESDLEKDNEVNIFDDENPESTGVAPKKKKSALQTKKITDNIALIKAAIDKARTYPELTDIKNFVSQTLSEEIQAIKKSKTKKRSIADIAKDANLNEFANKFGLSVTQLAENIEGNRLIHFPENYAEEPDDAAEKFTCKTFPEVKNVLSGVRALISSEISSNLKVRTSLRTLYKKRVRVNVRPTERGKTKIDEEHACYGLRYLKMKDPKNFRNAEILHVFEAEGQGFLEVKFQFDTCPMKDQKFFRDLLHLYCEESTEVEAMAWDFQREAILLDVVQNKLFPLYEKEFRATMTEDARRAIIGRCCENLLNRVNMKPALKERDLKERDFDVLGVSIGDNDVSTMLSFVGARGDVGTTKALHYFRGRQSAPGQLNHHKRLSELELLEEMIIDESPALINVCCEGTDTLHAYKTLNEFVRKMQEEDKITDLPRIELVSGEVARLHMTSEHTKEEFPTFQPRLRHTISIARSGVDALTEIAALVNDDDNLAILNLHKDQRFISDRDLHMKLSEVMCDVVSSVGVRINEVIENRYLDPLVQFLPGFGPRKARHFMEKARRKGQLFNREELVLSFNMGPRVFNNIVGFLRLDHVDRNLGDDVKVLDKTRIHPESYDVARQFAQDAFDDFHETENDDCIERVMEKPGKLNQLDLEKIIEADKEDGKNTKFLYYQIKDELTDPFKDPREFYRPLGDDEKFEIVTGRSPKDFEEWTIVNCVVVRISESAAFVRVEETIDGSIYIKNISDEHIEDINDRLQVGDHIVAVITQINIEQIKLSLSTKSRDLEQAYQHRMTELDEDFDNDAYENDRRRDEKREQEKLKKLYTNRRVINHENFHNYNYQEAEEALVTKAIGECVIRPSQHDHRALTITWKVYKEIYCHTKIAEFNKKDPTSLGSLLKIDDDEYEDLDEIIARHIGPMISLISEVEQAQHFHHPMKKKQLDQEVILEQNRNKQKGVKTIPYFISPSVECPGQIMITYLPNTTVRHEYIKLTPEGFQFHDKVVSSVPKLLDLFKKRVKDLAKQAQNGGRGRHGHGGYQQPYGSGGGYQSHSNHQSSHQPSYGGYASQQHSYGRSSGTSSGGSDYGYRSHQHTHPSRAHPPDDDDSHRRPPIPRERPSAHRSNAEDSSKSHAERKRAADKNRPTFD